MNKKATALGQHFRKLGQDLKTMTFRQKLDHIWTYYKEYMLVGAVIIAIFVAIITSLFNAKIPVLASGVMGNCELSTQGHDYMTDGFRAQYLQDVEGRVQLTKSEISMTNQSVQSIDASYNAYMGVISMVNAKNLDYIFMDAQTMQRYMEDAFFQDLTQILPADQLEELKKNEKIVYVQRTDGTLVPQCVEITALPFGQECFPGQAPVFLAFVANSPRQETCRNLWEHMMNWKTPEQTGQ